MAQPFISPILAYGLICLLIYIGLWSTPLRHFSHQVDEGIWLRRSIRTEAIWQPQYQETFEVNHGNLNQLSGATHFIALGRYFAGIPAEAVKRYGYGYRTDRPTDEDIQAAIIQLHIVLSSLGLFIFALCLRGIYNYGVSIIVTALLISQTSSASSTWQWYDNVDAYRFYNISVFGSSPEQDEVQLAISIDQQPIGIIQLKPDGLEPSPLTVELSNGATHHISVRPLGLEGQAEAYLQAIQIRPYEGQQQALVCRTK